MNTIIDMMAQYGVLTVIAGLFIWEKISNSKTISDVLQKLKESSTTQTAVLTTIQDSQKSIREAIGNTTTALNMVQQSVTTQIDLLERHDKRAEYMNGDVKMILENVRRKGA